MLDRLARDKRSSLLGSFISYKENKVLWIRPQMSKKQPVLVFYQLFTFFIFSRSIYIFVVLYCIFYQEKHACGYTCCAMTLSITTLSITAFSIIGLFATLSINHIMSCGVSLCWGLRLFKCVRHYAECRYTEYHGSLPVVCVGQEERKTAYYS